MKESNAKALLEKYAAGKCTPEETAVIESWYLRQSRENAAGLNEDERFADMTAVRHALLEQVKQSQTPVRRFWPRVAAAASILILFSAGYFYLKQKPDAKKITIASNDVGPGSNKAILILSNGKQINVTNAVNGQLALQGSNVISKTADGQIVYLDKKSAQSLQGEGVAYNTIKTPAGGQYRVVLSDGTRVLLNAGSSLTYPAKFAGKDRTVNLTGEAYFEVAHRSKQPFFVKTRGQVIEDIGTQFNVNAYEDESYVKTTLIEGSVKVYAKKQSKILVPGQQVILDTQGLQLAKNADIDEAISWKEGYFNFNTETLETAMKNLSRWYDVEIEYKNKSQKNKLLGGTISKYKNVSQVLKKMELTGAIHFQLIGHKIIVE